VREEVNGENVEVSREAIATLAAQAACRVEGVVTCQLKTVDSITSRVKREFVHQGVKLEKDDDSYRLSVYLRVRYGVNLPTLAQEVRSKVKEYVEGLTQEEVKEVEVVIEDIEASTA
jgi:uncharacterized alkaline shock family protein YloU